MAEQQAMVRLLIVTSIIGGETFLSCTVLANTITENTYLKLLIPKANDPRPTPRPIPIAQSPPPTDFIPFS